VASRDQEFELAFAELYALAWRAAMRILGEPAAAEDVAAETLTRAYVRWPRMATFAAAWVVRTATNLAIDGWRRQGRRPLAPRVASGDPAAAAAASVDLAVGLRALPRRQREAVVLRHLNDLPEAAVAAAMGCSTGAVKQHTARGLAALRSALGDDEE
jgi:RNA polymerase sigma factor (sigma-70 family)